MQNAATHNKLVSTQATYPRYCADSSKHSNAMIFLFFFFLVYITMSMFFRKYTYSIKNDKYTIFNATQSCQILFLPYFQSSILKGFFLHLCYLGPNTYTMHYNFVS